MEMHEANLQDPPRPGERRELLETNLARLLGWIAAADAKLSPILAINSAALGALAAFAGPIQNWTPTMIVLVATTLLLLTISLLNIFLANFPRTSGPKGSLVYFGGITDAGPDQFVSRILTVSLDEYAHDLAQQCYRNAQIAGEKFQHVRLAMVYLFVALVPWAVAIYLLYRARA